MEERMTGNPQNRASGHFDSGLLKIVPWIS
jgi:hypothetical protein